MATDVINEKQQVHELVNRLAPSQVAAVRGLLEAMLDPVAHALANAPIDDEEISEDEEGAVAEAREWLKHNKPIPHEEILAEFGLTLDDFGKMAVAPLPPEPRRNG
jgi:hypothetical protein